MVGFEAPRGGWFWGAQSQWSEPIMFNIAVARVNFSHRTLRTTSRRKYCVNLDSETSAHRARFAHHSYCVIAMILSGAPLPPPIFIGNAITQAPSSGNSSRFVTFSNTGTLCAQSVT